MNLADPRALLALLPLAGVIVALYLLRMRRRRTIVPATFLWPRRTEEVRANSLFQRLKFSWLMALQLLALAIGIWALARPQTLQSGLAGKATLFVLDAGASMGATDVKPSRFAAAVDAVRSAVETAGPGDRIALIEAGPEPRVVFPLGSDPTRQLEAMRGLQPIDAEPDMGSALRLATALAADRASAQIIVLSDGGFPAVPDVANGNVPIKLQQFGELADNLAIIALGTSETPTGRRLYAGVRNYGPAPAPAVLKIWADGNLIAQEKATVGPGALYGKTFAVPAGAQAIEAKLEAKDYLQADNFAVHLVQAGSRLRVLLLSDGNPFLERALALDPRVTLDRASSPPRDAAEKYDVVVWDGGEVRELGIPHALIFGGTGSPRSVAVQGSTREVGAVRRTGDGGLLADVDVADLGLASARRITPQAGAKTDAESNAGPLVVQLDSGDRREIYVGFSPLDSDFPLTVGFPIFIANALDFLGRSGAEDALAVRAGLPFALRAEGPVRLEGDEGTWTVTPEEGRALVRGLPRAGTYTATSNGQKRTVYATLRSEQESRIDPRGSVLFGGQETVAERVPRTAADFWRPFALALLAVLVIEWWVFARKS